MLDILLKMLVCFFACYGILVLLVTIIHSVRLRTANLNPKIKMILLVKNQEETIEGTIRSVYAENMLPRLMSGKPLTVVDMDSEDRTVDILFKLKRDYDFFEILRGDEKEEIFKEFE